MQARILGLVRNPSFIPSRILLWIVFGLSLAWKAIGLLHGAVFIAEMRDSRSEPARVIAGWLAAVPVAPLWQDVAAALLVLTVLFLGAAYLLPLLPKRGMLAAEPHTPVGKSGVRGEIVLFEPVTTAEHPEMYQQSKSEIGSAFHRTVKYGDAYDVGLHIENIGKPTRLRDWRFHIRTRGAPEVQCYLETGAWPPPKSWYEQFPGAMTLALAEASYIAPENVYVVYCQVRIKSYLDDGQQSLLELDSLEASATDNGGRLATFRIKGGS